MLLLPTSRKSNSTLVPVESSGVNKAVYLLRASHDGTTQGPQVNETNVPSRVYLAPNSTYRIMSEWLLAGPSSSGFVQTGLRALSLNTDKACAVQTFSETVAYESFAGLITFGHAYDPVLRRSYLTTVPFFWPSVTTRSVVTFDITELVRSVT